MAVVQRETTDSIPNCHKKEQLHNAPCIPGDHRHDGRFVGYEQQIHDDPRQSQWYQNEWVRWARAAAACDAPIGQRVTDIIGHFTVSTECQQCNIRCENGSQTSGGMTHSEKM